MFLSEKDLKKMKKSDVIAYAVKNLSSEPVTPSIAVEVAPPKKHREPSDWVKFVKANRKPGVGFADLSKMYKERNTTVSSKEPKKVSVKEEKVVSISKTPKNVESMSMPMKAMKEEISAKSKVKEVVMEEKPKKGDKKKD
jgi:hypothetical protein